MSRTFSPQVIRTVSVLSLPSKWQHLMTSARWVLPLGGLLHKASRPRCERPCFCGPRGQAMRRLRYRAIHEPAPLASERRASHLPRAQAAIARIATKQACSTPMAASCHYRRGRASKTPGPITMGWTPRAICSSYLNGFLRMRHLGGAAGLSEDTRPAEPPHPNGRPVGHAVVGSPREATFRHAAFPRQVPSVGRMPGHARVGGK